MITNSDVTRFHKSMQYLGRLLKEMRHHYMRHGTPLKLPSGLCDDDTSMTLSHVKQIQTEMEEGLKRYWYPRFLLHHLNASTTTLPTLGMGRGDSGCGSVHRDFVDRVPHPCKSHTPTFRRRTSSHAGYRNLSTPTGTRYRPLSTPTPSGRQCDDGGRSGPVFTATPASRLLWSRDSNSSSTMEQSAKYFSHLVKYTQYPILPTSAIVSTVVL